MNKFENFEGVELAKITMKLWSRMGVKICGKWQRRGGKRGTGTVRQQMKSGARTCQTLKVGDWVVWRCKRGTQNWGKGGRDLMRSFVLPLQELDGRLLKDHSPIEHLKVVEKALDKEQAYEVEKIVGHRGGAE